MLSANRISTSRLVSQKLIALEEKQFLTKLVSREGNKKYSKKNDKTKTIYCIQDTNPKFFVFLAFVCSCKYVFIEIFLSPHVRESTKVLDSGSQPLDSGFQPSGFRIPKPLWIPDSSLWIPDSNNKNLLDSGFRIPLHGAIFTFNVLAYRRLLLIFIFSEMKTHKLSPSNYSYDFIFKIIQPVLYKPINSSPPVQVPPLFIQYIVNIL